MTNTHWLDAWRSAHTCLAELRDAEEPDTIEAAHRRAVLAVDHAMLEAFARGVEHGKEKAKKEDDCDAR